MGESIEPFSLPDQFDHVHAVDPQTRLILFTRDKDVAKMAFGVLGRQGSSFLADHKAVVMLDISAMPRIISWTIAKWRMRRHGFPLLLDSGPGPAASLPSREKMLTVVYLRDLAVRDVVYVSDPAALEAALGRAGR